MYISLKDRFRTSVRHFRFEKKLSQEQLAELSNLTDKYISDIERGKTTPSLNTIDLISQALGLDVLELLTDKYYEECLKDNRKIDAVRGRIKVVIVF